jgi:hypothetical protein
MQVVPPHSTHTSPGAGLDETGEVGAVVDATAVSLWSGLMSHRGHRTVWLAADGTFLHTEPEVELEEEGLAYVATLLRPDLDELNAAMRRAMAQMGREVVAEPVSTAPRARPTVTVARRPMAAVGAPVLVG